jgi:hypothetical protein
VALWFGAGFQDLIQKLMLRDLIAKFRMFPDVLFSSICVSSVADYSKIMAMGVRLSSGGAFFPPVAYVEISPTLLYL